MRANATFLAVGSVVSGSVWASVPAQDHAVCPSSHRRVMPKAVSPSDGIRRDGQVIVAANGGIGRVAAFRLD